MALGKMNCKKWQKPHKKTIEVAFIQHQKSRKVKISNDC